MTDDMPPELAIDRLYDLRGELDSLRAAIANAEVLADALNPMDRDHSVITFAYERASEGVMERALLRLREALTMLDVALRFRSQESLYEGPANRRRMRNPVFAALVNARDKWVAHKVEQVDLGRQVWREATVPFGGPWQFLGLVLGLIELDLRGLDAAGAFAAQRNRVVTIRPSPAFTHEDAAGVAAAARDL